MANKTNLEQLDVQNITNNGSAVGFENGLVVPTGVDIRTGAAGIKEDNQGNVIINGNNYGVIATSNNRNTFTEPNTFNRSVLLPGSPTTPDKAEVTGSYITRETANNEHTVVDNSETLVNLIAGDTVRCKNLIPYPYKTTAGSSNGITYTVNSDGSITVNGTATALTSYSLLSFYVENLVGQTVALSMGNGIDTNSYVYVLVEVYDDTSKIGDFSSYGTATTYTIPETAKSFSVAVAVKSGATVNNFVVYPMLEIGTTATGFQPYFEGLKHAYFKGIKSTGKNLFNEEYVKGAYSALNGNFSEDSAYVASKEKIKVIGGQSYYIYYEAKTTERVAYVIYYDENGKYISYIYNPTAPFVVPSNCAYINIDIYNGGTALTIDDVGKCMVTMSSVAKSAYVPYVGEQLFELPETLELGEWDSYNPQTGELVRATKEIVITGEEPSWNFVDAGTSYERFGHHGLASGAVGGSYRISNKDVFGVTQIEVYSSGWVDIYDTRYKSVEEWTNYLKSLNAAGTPLRIAYKLETPTTETIANVPKGYTVYNGGTETIVGNSNDVYGVLPTISQVYSIHENPTEAANKAYVNNGLAKKLDKTGGTITGNLIVEGKTDTELGAIVSKQNGITYGLAYNGDAYKLGEGTLDEDGDFTFNQDEGLPIALRDDSSAFTNGHVVTWSVDGNKLVDSGLLASNLTTKDALNSRIKNLLINNNFQQILIDQHSKSESRFSLMDGASLLIEKKFIDKVGTAPYIRLLHGRETSDGEFEKSIQYNIDSIQRRESDNRASSSTYQYLFPNENGTFATKEWVLEILKKDVDAEDPTK